MEGKVEKVHYTCTGKSALQVRRNAEGYSLDFSGYDVPEHYLTAHKGGQWVAVVASEMTGDSAYDVTTVLTEAMKQEMTSDASAWAAEISQTGHAAVYGIEFDTGKATLKPESEKVLGDVLSLLQAQPDWKMKIEGHIARNEIAGIHAYKESRRISRVCSFPVKRRLQTTARP